ncbi:hypothetical protein K439DRAFT_945060 [Ramaria rubella]|nr:hypothetical protein K439DRAFT_945060 [Ramaria rubella]
MGALNTSLPSQQGHHIHRLAPELLGDIFFYCLPSPSRTICFTDAPLLLLEVCRLWRHIASGTPHLWTDVNMEPSSGLNFYTLLLMWLKNSGSLPLKIHLPHYHRKRPELTKQSFRLLFDNFDRISELKGSLTPHFANYLLAYKLPIRAPFLKLLSVGGWDIKDQQQDWQRLRGCIIAPQLEICRLNSARFQLSLLTFNPARLQVLSGLWPIDVAEFEPMDILSLCTGLHTLDIQLHAARDASVLQIPATIAIHSLRHLRIGIFEGYDARLFLQSLDVPFVENLAVFGTLAELPLISQFVELDVLTLERCVVDTQILRILTPESSTPSSTWICPLLSTLVIKRTTLPWDAAVDLVRNRAPTGTSHITGRLSRVVFEECNHFQESHQIAFTEIQKSSADLIRIDFTTEPSAYHSF